MVAGLDFGSEECSDPTMPTKALMSLTDWSKMASTSSTMSMTRPKTSKFTPPKSCVHAASERMMASSGPPLSPLVSNRASSAAAPRETLGDISATKGPAKLSGCSSVVKDENQPQNDPARGRVGLLGSVIAGTGEP